MSLGQRTLSRIHQQLGGLTISQKVALALGAVLVAGSLAWMVQWAAEPTMLPLWQGELAAEDLARVRSGLDAMGERYEVRGSTVLVPAGTNARAVVARLQQADKMPSDLTHGFEALVKESNPWLSQAENDRRWTIALQRELESVLRNFTGVETARVFLNLNAERRGFARTAPAGSASVTLFMRGGVPLSEALAMNAARMVAGSVRGLALQHVSVVDGTGHSPLDWETQRSPSTTLQRERIEQEKLIRDKIRNQLAFDPLALVNVRVELNFSTQTSESHTLDDPVEVSEESSSEQRTNLKPNGPAGVQPNVGVAVSQGNGAEQFTRETIRSEKQSGFTHSTRSTPGGETFAIFAAINISHSYLEQVFRRFNENAAAPTLQQIEQVFEQEQKRIVAQISKLVKGQDDRSVTEQIAVSWYYDPPATASGPAAAAAPMMELAQRYGPQAGLGLLALLAVGLMFRLAKRPGEAESFGLDLGLPREAVEAAQRAAGDLARVAGRGRAVKRASEKPGAPGDPAMPTTSATEGVLIAREVDEATVQIQKMIQEVDEMVQSDSGSVATLFEQWIDRSEKTGP